MGESVKVLRNGTITIPSAIRKELALAEGDFLTAEIEGGRLVLVPAKLVDAEDAWFYTKEWQAMEAEADREIAAGRLSKPYTDIDELMRDLDSDAD